jgi:hypothetical protein
MACRSLLDLPPEIVDRILSHTELQSLLNFGRASKTCHHFHRLSLHELSFGVFPCRVSARIGQLSETTNLSDIIGPVDPTEEISEDKTVQTVISDGDKSVFFPVHDVLTRIIIDRYSTGLRTLHLSVWRLEWRLAVALSRCPGIGTLTVSMPTVPFRMRRRLNRSSTLNTEERSVWLRLAGELSSESWTTLRLLRLVRVEIPSRDLGHMMKVMLGLNELWMTACESGFLSLDLTKLLSTAAVSWARQRRESTSRRSSSLYGEQKATGELGNACPIRNYVLIS